MKLMLNCEGMVQHLIRKCKHAYRELLPVHNCGRSVWTEIGLSRLSSIVFCACSFWGLCRTKRLGSCPRHKHILFLDYYRSGSACVSMHPISEEDLCFFS